MPDQDTTDEQIQHHNRQILSSFGVPHAVPEQHTTFRQAVLNLMQVLQGRSLELLFPPRRKDRR